MSLRALFALAVLAVLAVAAPAAAQPTTDAVVRIQIKSWGPKSARPGEPITIEGTGFGRSVVVLAGGKTIPASVSPRAITFSAPDAPGKVEIRLRKPKAEDTVVGMLAIDAPPPRVALAITGFTPGSGPAGQVVRINGRGFAPSDAVLFGKRPAQVIGRGEGWVDVKVPADARRPERFFIRGEYGEVASVAEYVLDVPPKVGDVRPRFGPPGSPVTIRGARFREGDLVVIGGKRADLVSLDERQIVVTAPYGTPGGDVVVRRGGADYPARGRFDVLTPPTITSFVPTKGEPGARVTLTGTGMADAQVWYGRARVTPTKVADTALELEIPRNADSARFRIKTRAGEATSANEFTILVYGSIVDAKPRRVAAGGTIILYGEQLDRIDRIALGDVELTIGRRGDRERKLEVTVPPRARSGKLAWWSNGRKAETSWTIDVARQPTILSFQPDSGPTGTRVIVRGDGIDDRTELFYGTQPMRVVQRGPGQLIGLIPAGVAGRDHLYLQGEGERVRSSGWFTVRSRPVVRSLSPSHGPAGSKVAVRGEGFDDTTEVLIGSWRAVVVKRRGGEIEIEVPKGAKPGDYAVTAKSGPQTTIAAVRFVVDEPERHRGPPRDHRKDKGKGGVGLEVDLKVKVGGDKKK